MSEQPAVTENSPYASTGTDPTKSFLARPFSESELIFGLIGAVGTELSKVQNILEERLKVIGYKVTHIRITRDIIPQLFDVPNEIDGEAKRISAFMDAGNKARVISGDNSILALGTAAFINSKRTSVDQHAPKHAYIVNSLKHPDEVARMRYIYPQGFYLIGVHADESRRLGFLIKEKGIEKQQAQQLIERDQDEHLTYGQRVADTFHLSDFFVRSDSDEDHLKSSLWRILDLLFCHPYITPTFDEHAMFLAFAASLHSADLSRQVGAVIAVNNQIIATGANDTPKAGGGQYWPQYDAQSHEIKDEDNGRDYVRGEDSNQVEQMKIIEDILAQAKKAGLDEKKVADILNASRIRDLTEYGRVVHAEMDALLSCARAGGSVKSGTLYSTTFPCHNCAKHIVAAGIKRVVFIEPYQKSKAAIFHTDSINVGFGESTGKSPVPNIVQFEPFVGVGPRRFFDLFSIQLGSGNLLKRKNSDGRVLDWKLELGRLRLQMLPVSYLELELIASELFQSLKEKTHV